MALEPRQVMFMNITWHSHQPAAGLLGQISTASFHLVNITLGMVVRSLPSKPGHIIVEDGFGIGGKKEKITPQNTEAMKCMSQMSSLDALKH